VVLTKQDLGQQKRKDNNIYICAPTVKQAKRIYWDRLNKMLKFVPKKVSLTDHLINISHNNNTIYVEGYNDAFKVTVYESNTIKYLPF
jgi:phage terminase large subunit-like protein